MGLAVKSYFTSLKDNFVYKLESSSDEEKEEKKTSSSSGRLVITAEGQSLFLVPSAFQAVHSLSLPLTYTHTQLSITTCMQSLRVKKRD